MLKKAKILIVDDAPLNRLILERTLANEYDVFSQENGEKALNFLKSNTVDLIVLDIVMPGLNGYEVLGRLKEDQATQAIPVIFISANTSHDDEAKGFELGAMDYITKPFSTVVVKARVKNQLLIKQKNDLLEMLVAIDGLTEIPNRRFLDETLSSEWRRSVRNHTPLSVIIADIDHFKRYNDHYGHRAGDECLKKVAQTLANQCQRGGEFVARYGGEEFAAVLPGVNKEQALAFANKLRDAIKLLNIAHNESLNADHVTISLGVATTQIENPQADTLLVKNIEKQLLEEADSGLYEAKNCGRDKIIARSFVR